MIDSTPNNIFNNFRNFDDFQKSRAAARKARDLEAAVAGVSIPILCEKVRIWF